MISIIVAIILFSIIILFHELGHFLLAKANNIRVNEFSLGLGPTICGFTIGETKYSLKLLPFGGACMMEGEDDSSTDERAFNNKSVWARISVVAAGPVFNFIMAGVFAFIMILNLGYDKPVLGDVLKGYAAEEAGIRAGDEIVSLNSYRVYFYREISAYSTFHTGEEVMVTYRRDGEEYKTKLVPKLEEETGRYLYGFVSSGESEYPGIVQGIGASFHEVKYWIYITLQSLKQMITGKYGMNELSGPVAIVKTVGDSYEENVTYGGIYYGFLSMLNWGILLAANLGVMNLLPLPALDGGRLFFMFIEAIRRKKIDPEKEGMVHGIGILLLLLLMGVVMFNDIRKLFLGLL